MSLPASCEACRHDPGLPDEPLRQHALAAALHAVERVLLDHGYRDVERSLEIIHVAAAEAFEREDHATGLH